MKMKIAYTAALLCLAINSFGCEYSEEGQKEYAEYREEYRKEEIKRLFESCNEDERTILNECDSGIYNLLMSPGIETYSERMQMCIEKQNEKTNSKDARLVNSLTKSHNYLAALKKLKEYEADHFECRKIAINSKELFDNQIHPISSVLNPINLYVENFKRCMKEKVQEHKKNQPEKKERRKYQLGG